MKRFPGTFWSVNAMELFERWAWYGMLLVIPLYLTGSKESGALEFSQTQKGMLLGIVTTILYFFPLLTGALADKAGYKRMLLISFAIISSGYLMMGFFQSYYAIFFAFLYLAVGAALFKPIIGATVSKTTTPENSTLGFGIYYMIINIGGFIGPAFASKLRVLHWKYVFIASSVAILLNIILLIFYKEPVHEKSKESLGKLLKASLRNSFEVLTDLKLLAFILILVGFWSVYWQLFYSLPVFIDQWVVTNDAYKAIHGVSPFLATLFGNAQGKLAPEMMVNLCAATIIAFQLLVSAFAGRFRPVSSILTGVIIATLALSIAFLTRNPWIIMSSIIIMAFGEMAASPRTTEYTSKLAPIGKTAGYVGSSFIPIALGNFVAGFLSGPVYQFWSDKYYLMKKDLILRYPSDSNLFDKLGHHDLEITYTLKTGLNENDTINYLWNIYHPHYIAFLFLFIGLLTVVALWIYNQKVFTGR